MGEGQKQAADSMQLGGEALPRHAGCRGIRVSYAGRRTARSTCTANPPLRLAAEGPPAAALAAGLFLPSWHTSAHRRRWKTRMVRLQVRRSITKGVRSRALVAKGPPTVAFDNQ